MRLDGMYKAYERHGGRCVLQLLDSTNTYMHNPTDVTPELVVWPLRIDEGGEEEKR